jgi:hypothetical protein
MAMTILCSCRSSVTLHGDDKTNDFRNASWGDSMADVMAGDKADIQPNGPKTLYGKDTLLNDDECEITYTFNDSDQLIKGEYTVKSLSKSNDESYADYSDFLKHKYGEPIDSGDMGNMHYAYYETPRTKIKLGIAFYEMSIVYEPLIDLEEKDESVMGSDGL